MCPLRLDHQRPVLPSCNQTASGSHVIAARRPAAARPLPWPSDPGPSTGRPPDTLQTARTSADRSPLPAPPPHPHWESTAHPTGSHVPSPPRVRSRLETVGRGAGGPSAPAERRSRERTPTAPARASQPLGKVQLDENKVFLRSPICSWVGRCTFTNCQSLFPPSTQPYNVETRNRL